MPYSLNPHLPKVRAAAVRLVRERGFGVRQAARYVGVQPGTISKWLAKAPRGVGTVAEIPTASSRPHTSPLAVPRNVVERIVALRQAHGRCAVVLHRQLQREGIAVSHATVERTLRRQGLIRPRSPWKVWHQSGERPATQQPGDLLEMDSIHLWLAARERTYILTLLDCYSRWAWAWAVARLTSPAAVALVGRARQEERFPFRCVQSDHGPEFGSHFTRRLTAWGIRHRHSRVRQPNDQAHVERFNRTLQDELAAEIRRWGAEPRRFNRALRAYLVYYNTERPHLGLACRTPAEVFPRC